MYRIIKFIRTRNDKIRVVVIRKVADQRMAEFLAVSFGRCVSDDSVVGFQRI